MTSVLTKAGEDLDRIASMFSGLTGLAAELKRLGGLDQAKGEVEARLVEYNRKEREGREELARTEAKLAEARDACAVIEANAARERAAIAKDLADYRAEMQKMRDATTADCNALIAITRERAEDILAKANADADQHVSATSEAMETVEAEIARKQSALVALEQTIKQREGVLNSVNDKIEALKRSL